MATPKHDTNQATGDDLADDIQKMSGHDEVQEIQIEIAQAKLNEVDLNTLARSAITWKSKAALRLALVIVIQGLSKFEPSSPIRAYVLTYRRKGVAAFAIDGSIIGNMSALPAFREHFNVGTSGGAIALVLAGMSIGNIFASLFQWLSDLIGRRGVTFLGNFILVISCILQAAAPNRSVLILGRVIGGIGCSLSATVGPLYMSEVAPSSHRGLAVGLYCSCYGVGSILIAIVMLGGSYMHGDWTWRMPMVFQLAPPLIVCCLVYPFTPESPRYLIYKGQVEKAKKIIATYHTVSGSVDDPVVGIEIQQMQASIESVDSKPWDFSTLWNKKSSLYRMRIILIYAFIQQCNGTCESTLGRPAHSITPKRIKLISSSQPCLLTTFPEFYHLRASQTLNSSSASMSA